MPSFSKPFILFTVLALMLSTAWAAPQPKQSSLKNLAIKFKENFALEKNKAEEKANRLGMQVKGVLPNGQVFEIMRFDNNMPDYYITNNLGGAELLHTDQLWPGGNADWSLTGGDQTLGVWDGGGVRLSHQEFQGRIIQKDNPSYTYDHPTHVSGTMAAAGTDNLATGMSPQASVHAYDWNSDRAEMAAAAADGLRVSNHSYGSVSGWAYGSYATWFFNAWHWFGDVQISKTEDYTFGLYTPRAKDLDEIAFNAPHYVIVKSAGNDRNDEHQGDHYYWDPDNGWRVSEASRDPDGGANGYDSIPSAGNAKNIITVGAVDSSKQMSFFSGWGPTDDGRVKPDIVAKGMNVYSSTAGSDKAYATWAGTSMSSPMISGSIGLLLEHQKNLYGQNDPYLSSTIKGLILHAADDSISGAPGPDYRYGWGLMDTRRCVQIMSLDAAASGEKNIYELSLSSGQEVSIPVYANGQEPLRATLSWTDPAADPPSPSLNPTDLMLVNDLDLRIEDSQGNTFFPYVLDPDNPSDPASTGDNIRDNVEMVHIQNPESNTEYQLRISCKGEVKYENQDFSLIVTGGSGSSADGDSGSPDTGGADSPDTGGSDSSAQNENLLPAILMLLLDE